MSGAADPSTEAAFLDMRAMMTIVPDFATNDRLVEAVRLVDREQREARQCGLRYRVAVLGTDTTDLVEHVGGLLFDHIMAGWQVTALVPDTADPRPLQILGTRILDLDTAFAMHLDAALTARDDYPWPDKIIIAGDLAGGHPLLSEAVRRSFDDGDINTIL